MTRLTFIRHAESLFNAAWRTGEVCPNLPDPDLTECGREQARQLKHWLQNRSFDQVFTSPYRRALRTTELIGLATGARVEPLLREEYMHPCDVGSSREQLNKVFSDFDLKHIEPEWWIGGGALVQRIQNVWHLFDDYPDASSIAVVGHRGFFAAMLSVELENCEVIEFEKRGRGFSQKDNISSCVVWRPNHSAYAGSEKQILSR